MEKWNADKTSYYDEKINRLTDNRNLEDHSCFIGVKTADLTYL